MTAAGAVRYCAVALFSVFIAEPANPAIADTVDRPECHSALTEANRLMHGVQQRQTQFSRSEPAENCRLLRDNLDDLTAARKPLNRCLTGDEHTKSLSQLDAAIGQIRVQLIGNCRR
jgi:hypothetical protein